MNETSIIDFCRDTALNGDISSFEAMKQFIMFTWKPIMGFFVGFLLGFMAVSIMGAIALSKSRKKYNFGIFILATIVGFLSGAGGFVLVSWGTMNGV